MRENQRTVSQGDGDHAPGGTLLGQPVYRPEDKGIPDEGVELGEGIAPDVNVDQVKGRKGVGCRRQHYRPRRTVMPSRPECHGQRCQQEAERLRGLNRQQRAETQRGQAAAEIVGECRIVVEEGIAQVIGGVAHPTRREEAMPEIIRHLQCAHEQKGAVAAAARVDQAWSQQRAGGQQRQEQGVKERRACYVRRQT